MNYFIGATLKLADDSEQFWGPIVIPGNMSKAETIAKHVEAVQKMRLAQRDLPAVGYVDSLQPGDDPAEYIQRPILSVIRSAVVTDGEKTLFSLESKDAVRGEVAAPFVAFLLKTFPYNFCDVWLQEEYRRIYGFGIKRILTIAALEVFRTAMETRTDVVVPCGLWNQQFLVYDPLDMILAAGDRKDVDLYSLLRYAGIETTPEVIMTDATVQAYALVDLVRFLQLARF